MNLAAFRDTKLYDFLMAVPLILWFGNGVVQLRARLVAEAIAILDGQASLFIWIQFLALLSAALFNLMLVWLLVVRDKPILRARGLLPRITGFAGTFFGVSILHLPVAPLNLAWQIVAALLVMGGCLGSAVVLAKLGKSFSIMPEARRLVTDGPYAYARHPLYAVELVTIAGTAIQFQQPWATLLALVVVALIYARTVFEEQVLSEAYPEYAAYRARVKRFIPGVI
jgi:protein-S-isoprenylcysteine O-methyltransferase Ste14